MRNTVLDLSNTCSSVTPVDLVGGFQHIIDVYFPYNMVVHLTSSVGASKEPLLHASNYLSLQIEIDDMCHAEGMTFNHGEKSQFWRLLKLSICVGDSLISSNRHLVSG